MKTAVQWMNQFTNDEECSVVCVNRQIIKEIQLDSFKAGERWAAEIVLKQHVGADLSNLEITEQCQQAILDDTNNRTELPV